MAWVSLSEARAEGFSSVSFSDSRVEAAIAEVEDQIARVTGNWFDARTLTLRLDGKGGDTLLLSHPIISISSVSVNGEALSVADDLAVYNRHLSGLLVPDDRHNPKIVRRSGTFPVGLQNVVVVGSFGYRDYDALQPTGKVPATLKRAVFMLLRRSLEQSGGPYAFDAWRNHNLKKIATRGQSREYGGHVEGSEVIGVLTGDVEVDRLLARFVAPFGGGAV